MSRNGLLPRNGPLGERRPAPIWPFLLLCSIVAATVSIFGSATLQLDPGRNIALTSGASYPNPPYNPTELWGGGNPVEHCNACDLNELLAQNKATSIQSAQSVSPATGDFTTDDTVIDTPADGGFFGLMLNYDAERADQEIRNPSQFPYSNPGIFGYGWQSNFNSSVYVNSATAQVNQYNGAEVDFTQATNQPGGYDDDGCPSSSYDDTQKYTIPTSTTLFCGAGRVDAQMGTYPPWYQFQEQGGAEFYTFNIYGALIDVGTNVNTLLLNYQYDISPGSTFCPSNGETSCDIENTSESINDARGITLEINGSNPGQVVKAIAADGTQSYSFAYTYGETSSITNNQTGGVQQFGYGWGFPSPYSYNMVDTIDPLGNESYIFWLYVSNADVGMVSGTEDPTGKETTYSYSNTTCASTNSSSCFAQGTTTQTATVTYPDGEIDTDAYQGAALSSDSYGPTANDGAGDVKWAFSYTEPSTQDGPLAEAVSLNGTQVATALTDAVGNVVYYTDPQAINTYNFYNDSGPNDLDELCWSVQNTGGSGSFDNATCNGPPASTGSSPVMSYTYDTFGHELSVTNPDGDTTRYGYYDANSGYAAGQECWEALPLVTGSGSTCASGSDSTAPTGSTVDGYDEWGNLMLVETDFNTSSATASWTARDVDGQKIYTIPPDGNGNGGLGSNPYETAYTYSSIGFPSTVVTPAYGGATLTTNYQLDKDGNTLVTWTSTSATSAAYDADGRNCWTMVSATAPSTPSCSSVPQSSSSQAVTTYAYGVPGTDDVTSETDPDGNTTTYQYNDLRFPTSVTATIEPTVANNNPQNVTIYDAYDQFGNVCLSGPVSPPSGCTWTAGDSTSVYNLEGQLTSTTDPGDTADPNGVTTTYSYGDNAYPTQATSMVRGSGTSGAETTNYGYDAAGLEIYAQDNEGNYVSMTTDKDGRECWVAPQNVYANQGTCPGLGGTPTGTGVSTFAYDGNGNLSTMVDNNGASSQATTSYQHDADGNLTSVTDDNSNTVSYQYNDADQETCIAYPVVTSPAPNCSSAPGSTNTVVDRAYDTVGRLSSVTDWLGNTTSFSNYNQLNELGKITYPSATTESLSYSYDDAGNLTGASYGGPLTLAGSQSADSWTPNAEKKIGATTALDGFNSSPDVYNQYEQITKAVNPVAGGGSASGPDTYTYAANGQIQSDAPPSGSATNFTYQAGSQELIQTVTGSATTTFGFTGDGQRQTQQVGSSTPTQYGWNRLGQLCASGQSATTISNCTAPSGGTSYSYDGRGLRISSATGSATQKYLWDPVTGGSTPLDIDDSTNAYIYGPILFGGTAPVEQINLSTGKVTWLASTPSGVQMAFDHAGSSDTLDEQAAYTLFGTQVLQSGTKATPFGFQGSFTDASGLIFLINRYYDPGTEQFLSVDPDVTETGQPYAYTADDPLNLTDALGLVAIYIIARHGTIRYVGIGNEPPNRKSAHKNGRGVQPAYDEEAGDKFVVIEGTNDLPRSTARGVEQGVINAGGFASEGGLLDNKINSIRDSNSPFLSAAAKFLQGHPGVVKQIARYFPEKSVGFNFSDAEPASWYAPDPGGASAFGLGGGGVAAEAYAEEAIVQEEESF